MVGIFICLFVYFFVYFRQQHYWAVSYFKIYLLKRSGDWQKSYPIYILH
jgi:hypothetical protein